MLIIATTKDARNSVASAPLCAAENEEAFLTRSRPVAASIVGTARRTRTPIVRATDPWQAPPTTVAPERERVSKVSEPFSQPAQALPTRSARTHIFCSE
jgi:hypothetical protein